VRGREDVPAPAPEEPLECREEADKAMSAGLEGSRKLVVECCRKKKHHERDSERASERASERGGEREREGERERARERERERARASEREREEERDFTRKQCP
jgi:hypothetical protein